MKHQLTNEEKKVLNFHTSIIGFHDMVIKEIIKKVAYKRLKLSRDKEIKYDLSKGEIYESELPINQDKRGKGRDTKKA